MSDIVVVDSGTVLETTESSIIAKEEADRAEKWAKYSEAQAGLSANSALEAAQSRDAAEEAQRNANADADNAAESARLAAESAKDAHDTAAAFDTHAAEKTNEFDIHAQGKTDDYDLNAALKTQDFNTNAADKIEEARKWAVGTIVEQPQGSAKHWAEEAEKSVKKSSFGNIGDIKYTLSTDVPNGGAWCDGAEYTQAMFPDLYQMLVDGKLQSTTYQNFASSVSTHGSCGFFALNTSTKKFKVPLLKDVYLKAGQAPVMFGAESSPNIKGEGGFDTGNDTTKNNGAIYPASRTTADGDYWVFNIQNRGDFYKFGFDASRSSSVYKDGAKVNPDHVVYRAYVVLYASAAEASVAQAAEFMTALGGKANVDMSNVNTVGKEFISTQSKSSNRYVDLELGASEATYVAPANGKVILDKYAGANNQYMNMFILDKPNGQPIRIISQFVYLVSVLATIEMEVKKGDIFGVTYTLTGRNEMFRFIYDEGVK